MPNQDLWLQVAKRMKHFEESPHSEMALYMFIGFIEGLRAAGSITHKAEHSLRERVIKILRNAAAVGRSQAAAQKEKQIQKTELH